MKTIEHVFSISKRVYSQELTQSEGARELEREHRVNINSAKIGIAVYAKLIQGLEFKRSLNALQMEYYLDQIFFESGSVALTNSLDSLWKHIVYYENKNKVNCKSLRKIANRFEARTKQSMLYSEIENDFLLAVNEASKVSIKERDLLLQSAPKKPKSRIATIKVYNRNPHVVVAVLLRADGRCEKCKSSAPFIRKKDKTPYLEVHHKTHLADNGDDTVENSIALCPNCHRELHHGL